MSGKEKILIVDDEKDIVKLLEYNLKKEGFRTVTAYDGSEALEKAGHEHPDLILLDVMLPEVDGLEVCKQIKKDPGMRAIPVIMLTARSQETDKVIGLELGADDYVTKPFGVRELLARVKARLRRTHEQDASGADVVQAGDITIDSSRIEVIVNKKPVTLTAKEFELLRTLAKAKGRVLSRDYLLDTILGYDRAAEIQTRTVDVHIRTLRKKLKGAAKHIVTVKQYGYRFEE